MRTNEIIQEIQRTGPWRPDKDDPQSDDKVEMPTDLKVIPGAKTMAYRVGKDDVSTTKVAATMHIELWDLRGKDLIGRMLLRPMSLHPYHRYFPMSKSMSVVHVNVYNKYRGQGLGQSLYGVATKILGYTIVSDDTQTPESRKMWVDLQGIPGMEISGWLRISRTRIDPEEARDSNDDRNVERYQSLIATVQGLPQGKTPVPMPRQRNPHYVYYSFPVMAGPDGKELQAAQQLVAIYTREHPDDSNRAIEAGLYARWKG